MLKTYFRIAWRYISRHKVFAIINVLGLALGICACTVIYLITTYELSFDTFHPDKERIYRIIGDIKEKNGEILHSSRLPVPVSLTARKEIAGLEVIAAISPYNAKISIPDGDRPAKNFDSRIEGILYPSTIIAEPPYFAVFKYNWLAGNAATALSAPFTVVLTESKARKYFGSIALDRMIGRQVIYDDSLRVQVSGIVEDWDKNTDFSFTDFISFNTVQNSFLKNSIHADAWGQGDMSVWTFVKLPKGTAPEKMNVQMNALVKKHRPADLQSGLSLWLEPLANIHFNAGVIENPIRIAYMPTLYSLMGIALFILIIAAINFINLSTAQSIQRAKEIGVRKVLGGGRTSLVLQFLTETFVLTFFAVCIAVVMVRPVLSGFHAFIPPGITFNPLHPSTFIFLLLVILVTSLLAGLYPAKVLSSYLPVLSLKGGTVQKGSQKWYLRKGLIVFQFIVSLVFIIGSIVISNQLKYTRNKDLGFSTNAIITISTPWGDSTSKVKVLAEKIKQLSGVGRVALQMQSPMDRSPRAIMLKFKSNDERETRITMMAGNEDVIPLYQMKLLAGRNLVRSDSLNEYVINEAFSRSLGFKDPQQAIGKMLYWNDQAYPVVGVVADFHESSFHDPIQPLCIVNRPEKEKGIAIKLAAKGKQPGNVKATISQIEKLWKDMYPGGNFNYRFFDESIAMLYEKDRKTAALMNTAMLITIFISCMGAFALAMFAAEQRTKEIGIRKVLGASVTNITAMLNKDFIILVAIAILIASPIAWYFMNQWLAGFAYRIHISWWVFAEAGALALLIALLTVSYQAVHAALMNPVKSLRTE